MRLLLTGDPIDAEEAHRLGLVEILVDDAEVDATAMARCRRFADYSPTAVQAVKATVRIGVERAA